MRTHVEVKVSESLRRLPKDVRERPIVFLREIADYTHRRMLELTPVRTGGLRNSIRKDVDESRLQAQIGAAAKYAPYVEFGTRPHLIEPVRARALRFTVGGEIVFARLVRHPGTKPQWFVRRAAEETIAALKELWRKIWSEGGK
ncbi:MAG: HK97 gp10 family phage protein [Candidatus Bathyarchaeia archaeon]